MSCRRGSYGAAPGPLAVAHRGGAGLAAENTIDAFSRSYALGLRHFETDVRLTADGQLVAFHDARLGRVTAAHGRVRDLTLSQLTRLRVLGRGTVLPLADLLAAYPDSRFAIDLKDPGAGPALADQLRRSDAVHRVCVAASRGSWLRALRDRTGPDLCTALSWRDLVHLTTAKGARRGRGCFAHVPLRIGRLPVFTDDLVPRAHALGVRVLVWTVDEPSTMHRLLDRGVDGIITDRPDLLREVLISRGQWHTPDTTALELV